MAVHYSELMIRVILQGEESDRRFERFCVDLFSEVDALEYSTTSANYDHGKDGRYIGQGSGKAARSSAPASKRLSSWIRRAATSTSYSNTPQWHGCGFVSAMT